uniref:Uncharacterized protein n=1 Tax=Ditylenchus dipsaci TaxID=166011 RepID=A0A915D2J1_9BILA
MAGKFIIYALIFFLLSDFKLAPVNALFDIFGDEFSWKQLQPAYNQDNARVLFRSLVALSFLPIEQVEMGFEEVREELLACGIEDLDLSTNLDDYLKYFERTYIRGRKCGRHQDVSLRNTVYRGIFFVVFSLMVSSR